MPIETVKYVVKKDDNLWNIVKSNGFPPKDWKIIYNSQYNIQFKKDHPDPNKITKGGVFYLPKWGPNAYAHIVAYMKGEEKALQHYSNLVDEMQKKIDAIKKSQSSAMAYISKLKKEAKDLEDIAFDANAECSGEWEVCLGAGMYASKTYKEAKAVMKVVANYEKLLKAKKYDEAHAAMSKKLAALKAEHKKALGIVATLKKSASAALKNPYK